MFRDPRNLNLVGPLATVRILKFVCDRTLTVSALMLLAVLAMMTGFTLGIRLPLVRCPRVRFVAKLVALSITVLCSASLLGRGIMLLVVICVHLVQLLLWALESL